MENLQGWQFVAGMAITGICIVLFFHGWPTFITINRTNCKCKCSKKHNEDEG